MTERDRLLAESPHYPHYKHLRQTWRADLDATPMIALPVAISARMVRSDTPTGCLLRRVLAAVPHREVHDIDVVEVGPDLGVLNGPEAGFMELVLRSARITWGELDDFASHILALEEFEDYRSALVE